MSTRKKAEPAVPAEKTFRYIRVQLDLVMELTEPVTGVPTYFHRPEYATENAAFILKDTGAPVQRLLPGARLTASVLTKPPRIRP